METTVKHIFERVVRDSYGDIPVMSYTEVMPFVRQHSLDRSSIHNFMGDSIAFCYTPTTDGLPFFVAHDAEEIKGSYRRNCKHLDSYAEFVENIALHEVGHLRMVDAMDYIEDSPEGAEAEKLAIIFQMVDSLFNIGEFIPNSYAGTDSNEWFAECFACHHQNIIEVPTEIVDLFRRFNGIWESSLRGRSWLAAA